MLVKLTVPPEFERFTATPVVVVTLTSAVTNPDLPEAVSPVFVVLVMLSPFTLEFVPIVTVFCNVGRVPPMLGLAMVPTGGVMPISASKVLVGVFVAPGQSANHRR